ncbi:MAG: hypothetical protein J6X33_07235 [Clostridiales bacterium]|nr:hypothetical protein [Clostridiales bacterium]
MNIFNEDKYFFVVDSNNYKTVENKIYGFILQNDGLYEADRAGELDPSKLDGVGTYVHIENKNGQVLIRQDFAGNFGLYIYQHDGYFAVSNSYIKLVDHVKKDHYLSLNRDVCNHYLSTWITTLSYEKTYINEIVQVPSYATVRINENGTVDYEYTDYKYNKVPVASEEGLKILDQWYEKWVRIIKNISLNTDKILFDLSGGMDSRFVFLFFLTSGVDLSKISIRSLNDGKHTHVEDFEIASEMAEKYGFKLNDHVFDTKSIYMSKEDVLNVAYDIKMYSEKELTYPAWTYNDKYIWFGGFGGEMIRPYWYMPLKEFYVKQYSSADRYPYRVSKGNRDSCKKVLDETVAWIDKQYQLNEPDSSMYSFDLFRECYSRNHFGRICVEAYVTGSMKLSPVMDPMLQQLTLNDAECEDTNLLYTIVMSRYARFLLDTRFDSGRKLNEDTVEFADRINAQFPYEKKDIPADSSFTFAPMSENIEGSDNTELLRADTEKYQLEVFHDAALVERFTKWFDKAIYDYADSFARNNPYFPLRFAHAVLAIDRLIRDVEANRESASISDEEKKTDVFGVAVDDTVLVNKSRLDICGKDYDLLTVSDPDSLVGYPKWFQKNGVGTTVESTAGILDVSVRSNVAGTLNIALRSPNKVVDGEKIPQWLKVTSFKIDSEEKIGEPVCLWHDRPVKTDVPVEAGQILYLHCEWKAR